MTFKYDNIGEATAKYDDMGVIIRNSKEKCIAYGTIQEIGRFGVVPDYTITLKRGQEIELHIGVVASIARDWIVHNQDEVKELLNDIESGKIARGK
jgi:hypothetical protein